MYGNVYHKMCNYDKINLKIRVYKISYRKYFIFTF